MKSTAYSLSLTILVATQALLLVAAHAVPMEADEEQSENMVMGRPESEVDLGAWDPINAAALRKFLLELDAEERMDRVTRSWPQGAPRGWAGRSADGRLARQWRTDKRQVRFRQCYFNPISCFRK